MAYLAQVTSATSCMMPRNTPGTSSPSSAKSGGFGHLLLSLSPFYLSLFWQSAFAAVCTVPVVRSVVVAALYHAAVGLKNSKLKNIIQTKLM